jgi:hypothetical protein
MGWMDGELDKVKNKRRCACGAESMHGVIGDNNIRIGEFCDECMVAYLSKEHPDSPVLPLLRAKVKEAMV